MRASPAIHISPDAWPPGRVPPLSVGQTLAARVLSVGEGRVVLQLNGVPLTAQTDLEMAAGARLRLRVESVSAGQVLLRLIPPTVGDGAAEDGAGILPSPDSRLADALARAGLPVRAATLHALRQALAAGLARSPDTLALLLAARREITPALTAALDALLDEDGPPLGTVLAKPESAALLPASASLSLAADTSPETLAARLRAVVETLQSGQAADTDSLPAEIAHLLRGQALLPIVRSEAGAPMPFLYLQIPFQVDERWRTLEVRVRRRETGGTAGAKPVTEVMLRMEMERFGRVEAQITAAGRRLALTFRLERPEARTAFESRLPSLKAALAQHALSCASISCHALGRAKPLWQVGASRLNVRG